MTAFTKKQLETIRKNPERSILSSVKRNEPAFVHIVLAGRTAINSSCFQQPKPGTLPSHYETTLGTIYTINHGQVIFNPSKESGINLPIGYLQRKHGGFTMHPFIVPNYHVDLTFASCREYKDDKHTWENHFFKLGFGGFLSWNIGIGHDASYGYMVFEPERWKIIGDLLDAWLQ